MVSLGCSKNQVDAERMLYLLRQDGFVLKEDPALCDVVIVNTCGFIEDAKKESIENILEFVSLKEEGRVKKLIVTGCLAERYRAEVLKEIPEADVVLGIGCNGDIAAVLRQALAGEQVQRFGDKGDLSLEGDRILANLPYFAYLKVAEGCDNRCSYCAIPLIRGGFRSRPMEDIVAEARTLASRGVTELNVVAQDTTRYGEDLYGKLMLPALLEQLCAIDGIHWVRVLYCYPERITDELLETMAAQPKIVKYMDSPVQHASGRILKAMNRRGDVAALTTLMQRIRDKVPGVALRTTMITGFPGETEEDFTTLCEFVRAVRFDRLGCFAYSREEDTPAYEMPDQLDNSLKQRRAEVIMEMQMGIAAENGERFVDETLEVLCEGFDRIAESWFGRSAMDAPDIDTKVFFTTISPVKPGDYVPVRIDDTLDYDLLGTRVEQ